MQSFLTHHHTQKRLKKGHPFWEEAFFFGTAWCLSIWIWLACRPLQESLVAAVVLFLESSGNRTDCRASSGWKHAKSQSYWQHSMRIFQCLHFAGSFWGSCRFDIATCRLAMMAVDSNIPIQLHGDNQDADREPPNLPARWKGLRDCGESQQIWTTEVWKLIILSAEHRSTI